MVDQSVIESAVEMILTAIGEDAARAGLRDTPARVARFWQEFADYDAGTLDTAFASVQTDQMIVLAGVRVWSLCEHHLLPFYADVAIGYITRDRVLGLSKLARIAHKHAHRLQIQERLTEDIAAEVAELTASPDVAVVVSGVHTCMMMRGIKSAGVMTTSAMHGAFRDEIAAREEFLSIAQNHNKLSLN